MFIAGQEDCRRTILDQDALIVQYLLIRPTGSALSDARCGDNPFPLQYRLRLERTEAAQSGQRQHRDRDLLKSCLRIKDTAVLPQPALTAPEIAYYWAEAMEC